MRGMKSRGMTYNCRGYSEWHIRVVGDGSTADSLASEQRLSVCLTGLCLLIAST